jgi:hypothetical protein
MMRRDWCENQSSVDFHEKFGQVGIIKESGLNLTAGCILFFVQLMNKKNRLFTNYFLKIE